MKVTRWWVPGVLLLAACAQDDGAEPMLTAQSQALTAFDVSRRVEAPARQVRVVAETLCGLPGNRTLGERATQTLEGWLDYQDWMANPAAQTELLVLEEALKKVDRDVLEPTFDHVEQEVVIPVEFGAASRVAQVLQDARIDLPLRVQRACSSPAALRSVQAQVLTGEWAAASQLSAFATYVDPAEGQLVVELPERDSLLTPFADSLAGRLTAPALEGAGRLQKAYGDLIRVEATAIGRTSRASDAAPHYGAAAIGSSSSMFCTSGFIVYLSGTTKGAVTAGHCFSNNTSVYSGTNFYGVASGKVGFPTYDMMVIEPFGETYSFRFYTDPGSPTSRIQTNKIDAPVGALVCTSGKNVKAICNIQVTTKTATLCDPPTSCTPNLTRGTKPDVVLSTPGDSGAVMYSADGTNGAYVLGMAIGAIGSDVLWHKTSDIESHLGVVVATQ